MDFRPYPKTPRLKRTVTVTEKLDGTNAQVVIVPEESLTDNSLVIARKDGFALLSGSRSRWITPGKTTDNYGFAAWCQENSEELFKLGEGQHFGEWYGSGIQRNYGLSEKRWALFNTARWGAHNLNTPACCEAVPVLYSGEFGGIDAALEALRAQGSKAAPGFMKPEGIIVYHSASQQSYKVLLENDEVPKGKN